MKKPNGIAAPVLQQESITVPGIGAAVVVRGLKLRERMKLFEVARQEKERYITYLLATSVCHEDGTPLWTEEQWEIFGGANMNDTLKLLETAQRLSCLDVESARKN